MAKPANNCTILLCFSFLSLWVSLTILTLKATEPTEAQQRTTLTFMTRYYYSLKSGSIWCSGVIQVDWRSSVGQKRSTRTLPSSNALRRQATSRINASPTNTSLLCPFLHTNADSKHSQSTNINLQVLIRRQLCHKR